MLESLMVTVEDLTRRFESVPRALKSTLEQEVTWRLNPAFASSSSRALGGFDVTGVGASEFPARLLVSALLEAGIRSQFRPISTFLTSPAVPPQTSLVVFSQGLSPNARLPFRHARAYDSIHLFTSIEAGSSEECDCLFELCDGVYRHLPESESGSLLRVLGPLCAGLLALRWAGELLELSGMQRPDWFARIQDVPERYEEASQVVTVLGADPAACLSSGRIVQMTSALMWKWQEALYTPLPAVFDVLSFAHGPLQSFVGKKALFLGLIPPDEAAFLPPLSTVMDEELHRLHLLSASLPGPLALFEYDAQVTAFALREMKSRGISPGNWPGRAAEALLYEVGR